MLIFQNKIKNIVKILNLMIFFVTIYVFKVAQVVIVEGDTSFSYGNYWWANTFLGVFLILTIPQYWKVIVNSYFSVSNKENLKIQQKFIEKIKVASMQILSVLFMVIFINIITITKVFHITNYSFFGTFNEFSIYFYENLENLILKKKLYISLDLFKKLILLHNNNTLSNVNNEILKINTTFAELLNLRWGKYPAIFNTFCENIKDSSNFLKNITYLEIYKTNINIYFFKDGVTFWLLWLVSLIFFIISFSSHKKLSGKNLIFTNFYVYEVILYFILFLIIVCFSIKNILIFFIAFEMILIPLFLHILFQGSRLNKIEAVKYLVVYTLVGSIFLWYALSFFIEILGTTNFEQIRWLVNSSVSVGTKKIIFLSLFLGFAFKIPLVPFHHWLVIAHVEAPTSGSIILAALLLKVGGYGMYRFVFNLFPMESYYFSNIILAISIFGYTYATLLAIRQVDLKRYVAYTSIAHMNFSLLGLFSIYDIGILGFVHMMISHGIIASALFFIVGHIYSILNFRDSIRITGLAYSLPKVSLFFFVFSLANMGLPLFSGFPGEFFIITSIVMKNMYFGLFIFFGFIFSGIYNFLQINKVLFSTNTVGARLERRDDLDSKSILILGVLLYWSITFGLFPDIITQNVEIYI